MTEELRVRSYGTEGPRVIALHGGPAAVGSAAPIARGLAEEFRVLEPWQRGSGPEPLTVARHVADLHRLIETRCDGEVPALVGWSWGAMLALAYGAAHPEAVGSIVLVGCGTFDKASRATMEKTIEERTDDALRRKLERLPEDFPDPSERILEARRLTRHIYDWSPVEEEAYTDPEAEGEPFGARAHEETWQDMLRCQREGLYPAAFAAIRSPVLMLHGAYDPHPGAMIRDSLRPYLPQFEYREWDHCGHSPWREEGVREEFFTTLREWLRRQFRRQDAGD
jgi:pimeloyl-ACP methyl ester carboxylesterase